MRKITIFGGTGNVGRVVTEMIASDPDFKNYEIRVTGSAKSAGSIINAADKTLEVQDGSSVHFSKDEICIFNTEAEISAHYIPQALKAGAYVIDSSSYYRMTAPLIVPSVNITSIDITKDRLFSHANCIVSPVATVLDPLHEEYQVDRIIASTYQSTAGAGKAAMDECFTETKNFCKGGERKQSNIFARPIPFNVIPQIGRLDENGISGEEDKIVKELQKLIDKNLSITATSVRVPVLIGHSVSLSMRLHSSNRHNISKVHIEDILGNALGIHLSNDYHTPIEVAGTDKVHVGRIRIDESCDEKWIHLWLCSDSLRVGAAVDAFLIAKEIHKQLS